MKFYCRVRVLLLLSIGIVIQWDGSLVLAQTSPSVPQSAIATDVPRTLSYQGLLSNADGRVPRDGQYAITARLYSDAEGVHAIYSATYQATVVNGMFNILLGSGASPLPSGELMNAPLWIGITVDGHEELKPYTPLSASPYALNVPNNAISTDKIADGAVSARKIGADYLGSLWIDGNKVTERGSKINLEGANGIEIQFDVARNTIIFSGNTNGLSTGNSTAALTSDQAVALLEKSGNNGSGNFVDGSLLLSTKGGLHHATVGSALQYSDHRYTIPDAGSDAQFVMSEGNQVLAGVKTFNSPINGSISGNAATATSALRASTADAVTNSWASGASIVAALMSNGGTLSNNTTGNAKSATFASSAAESDHAHEADQIGNTALAGASIDRAIKAYGKPLTTDISGTAAHALSASQADFAVNASHATELLMTTAAGSSAALALRTWGGTLANSISGNAGTVSNGVYTTGSYNDPLWIATISGSKITGQVANAQNAQSSQFALNATRAQSAAIADTTRFAATANIASTIVNSASAGQSISAALQLWNGTLKNNISGNAASVTNGLYSSGSYSDPEWLRSLSATKIIGEVPKAQFASTAGSATPSGVATGDLGGMYPSPKVLAVQTEAASSIVNAINQGSSTISALSIAKNLTISGGSINNSPIGTSIPATASFTTSQSTLSLGQHATPAQGTRYLDNTIVAWGDVNADGTIISQFGNIQVVHTGTGSYQITLPSAPTGAAVSVTSESPSAMVFSAIRTGGSITIHGYDIAQQGRLADGAFNFIVVTRP